LYIVARVHQQFDAVGASMELTLHCYMCISQIDLIDQIYRYRSDIRYIL